MTLRASTARPLFNAASEKQHGLMAVPLLGLACLAFLGHSVFGAWFGMAGFVWLIGLTILSMFISLEFAFALMMAGLFLQNTFTAIAAPLIENPDHYSSLLAGSFINIFLMAGFSAFAWLKWRSRLPIQGQALLLWTACFMGVIALYAGLGMASSSLSNVLIYGRIYIIGLLMLIIGLTLGWRIDFSYALGIVRTLTVILVAWGLFEFFLPYDLYELFNIRDFLNLKAFRLDSDTTFRSVNELIQYNIDPYLNLSGQFGLDLQFLRPKGPNIHSISYGYALAFCCLVCFINRSLFLSLAAFLMMFLVGTKGPLILTLAAFAVFFVYHLTKNRYWFLAALVSIMSLYFVGGMIYGYLSNDYHVLGFLGGVKGFLKNPFGRGIGVGGNMSSLGTQQADFDTFQRVGAADFALESAFGVMLYQFGIGIAVFLIFYFTLWRNVWKAVLSFPAEPRLLILPAALGLLLVNSVFQEEALSPLGWGLWLMFGGLIVGKYWRKNAS
jgi:hypothetical protein